MDKNEITKKLSDKGLRVTPQRTAILNAILTLNNHPTAENIIDIVNEKYPNIAVGTVYKVLESFVENKIVKKVKTENGVMRFDPTMEKHHHLYCEETGRIEDYADEELDKMINDYFRKKGLGHFTVKEFKIDIKGVFH